MLRSKIEWLVGLLLFLGLVSFVILALQVGGLTTFRDASNDFSLTAYFYNTGGLKEKARVSIAGVSVGRVLSVDLDSETFLSKVEMGIDTRKLQSLPIDSRASVLTAGLLGDNYIGITPGFSQDFLESGDIIPETQTDSAVVLEELISRFVSTQASQGSGPAVKVEDLP